MYSCHGRAEIELSDSLHDIGCKTIKVSAELASRVFDILEKREIHGITRWAKGKEYTRKDFTEETVKRVYRLFEEGLIEKYLKRKEEDGANIKLVTLENR